MSTFNASTASVPFDFVAAGIEKGKGKGNSGDDVLESMQAEIEQIEARSEVLENQLEDIDEEIAATEKAVYELRKIKAERTSMGALGGPLHMTKQTAAQTKLKEDLLARLRLQENSLAHEMTQAKARINSLRGEAMARNDKFHRLGSQLNDIKSEMVRLLERSNAALAARNEAAEALKHARAAEATARKEYEDKAGALATKISDAHLSRLQAAKAKTAPAVLSGHAGEQEAQPGDGPGSGNLTEEQEEAARENIMRLDQLIVEHEAIIADLHKQTSQLQEVFRAMIGQAGLDSLDQLVERFAEFEAFKYEIYGYVQHTSGETVAYEEMLRDTQAAQTDYVQQLAAAARTQRDMLTGMRQELGALARQAQGAEKQHQAVHAVAKQVVLELLRVYAAVGGDDTGRLSLLPHGEEAAAFTRDSRDAGLQRASMQTLDSEASSGPSTRASRIEDGVASPSTGPGRPSQAAGASHPPDSAREDDQLQLEVHEDPLYGHDGDGGDSDNPQLESLAVGREEIVSVLGFVEQAASDTSMALANALRDPSSRGLIVDGLQAWEGLVTREMDRAGVPIDGPAGEAAAAGLSGAGQAAGHEDSMHSLEATLHRNLRMIRHMRDRVVALNNRDAELLRVALHKQPAVPARAVVSQGSARPGIPSAAAVAALTTRPVEVAAPSHGRRLASASGTKTPQVSGRANAAGATTTKGKPAGLETSSRILSPPGLAQGSVAQGPSLGSMGSMGSGSNWGMTVGSMGQSQGS